MTAIYQYLQHIGVTKIPLDTGGDGAAFVGFISFAMSASPIAKKLRSDFSEQSKPQTILTQEDEKKYCAAYIDWLIVNHWGEEPSTVAEVD